MKYNFKILVIIIIVLLQFNMMSQKVVIVKTLPIFMEGSEFGPNQKI